VGWGRVGGKVGDGEIGFVADTGNHRHAGLHDGTRHHFFIERPQVLDAATAADQQYITFGPGRAVRMALAMRWAAPSPCTGVG
jgi:hypothetical protein